MTLGILAKRRVGGRRREGGKEGGGGREGGRERGREGEREGGRVFITLSHHFPSHDT